MKPIRIYVRNEDIQKGARESMNSCPIARAIRRETGTRLPKVDGDTCVITLRHKRILFRLPKAAKKFVAAYDSWNMSIFPFSFRISRKATA